MAHKTPPSTESLAITDVMNAARTVVYGAPDVTSVHELAQAARSEEATDGHEHDPAVIAAIVRAAEIRDKHGVDEYTVAIATTPPKVLRDITSDATIGEWSREYARLDPFENRLAASRSIGAAGEQATGHDDTPGSRTRTDTNRTKQSYVDGQMIDQRVWDLARRSRRRVAAFAIAGAVLFGGGALLAVGDAKAEFSASQEDEDTRFRGDRIIDGNDLTWDDHLLSGDQGLEWPIVGSLIRAVPGVPDFGSTERTTTTTETVTTIDENVVFDASYTAAEVDNPVAPDLELSGVEYDLARATATELLDEIDPKTFTGRRVEITGYVSDEFGGEIGINNPEQQTLADARAFEATRAFTDEASARGIDLSTVAVVVSGEERILTPDEITTINRYATELGFSNWQTLLNAYDNGQELPSAQKEFLDTVIRRGATITLTGDIKRTETIETTKTIPIESTGIFDDIPGETVPILPALVPIMYGMIFGVSRRFGNSVQRRARRQLRRAGIDIATLDTDHNA